MHTAERRVRAELARAAESMPTTTAGRAGRAALVEIGRRLDQLGDTELDVVGWWKELDLGVSLDVLRRGLLLASGATHLLVRVPAGRRVVYRARAGAALRGLCREATDIATAARAPEPEVPGGWQHPDALIVVPRAVARRLELGEARDGESGCVVVTKSPSPRETAYLRRKGVVRPDRLTRDVARVMVATLAERPWLLRLRRREAGIAPGEQHREDYAARVAECPIEQWIEEDLERARKMAQHSRSARRLEVYRIRMALGLDLTRPSALTIFASPEATPEWAPPPKRLRNGQFAERQAPPSATRRAAA